MPSTQGKETYTPLIHRIGHNLSSLSDFLNDDKLSRCDLLRYLSDNLDRPPSVLAKASIIFLLSVLLLNPSDLSGTLTNALGLLPSAYKTFQFLLQAEITSNTPGLKKKENIVRTTKLRRWLDYWVIYGTTCMLENVVGEEVLLAAIPFWWGVKACWAVWWLVGLLDDGRENEVRPKPLRLRPRSLLATKDSPSPSSSDESSEDEESPEPPSTGAHEKQEIDSDSEDTTSLDSAKSPPAMSPARAKAIREELRALDSPPLSRTPEFLPPPAVGEERAVTPITGISSSSDGSPLSESSSHGEEDSPDDSDRYSERSSSVGESDSQDESDESDNSDDVRLPPGTPLDELALIGKKTIELDSSDEEGSDNGNKRAVERQSQDKEEKLDDVADTAKKEKAGELKIIGGPKVNESIGVTKSSTVDDTEAARGKADSSEHKAERKDDIKPEHRTNQDSINPNSSESSVVKARGSNDDKGKSDAKKEGEVVKLSIEDLLAMDEGDQSNHESDAISVDEGKGKEGLVGTAPLEVKRKSGEAKREGGSSL